jgi:hypothetical protein
MLNFNLLTAVNHLSSKVSDPNRYRRDVTTTTTDSHGVASPSECCLYATTRVHRVPWIRFGVRRFRLTLAALLRAPSPASFETGSSSRALAPLQSAAVPCPPHRCSTARLLPGGFVPLRDLNQKRPPDPGFPIPESVPSSAFRTPPTVCSASGLAGLFHPAAASRVHSSGVFPPAKPYRLVDGPCPLAVIACPLLDGCPPCSTDLRPASRAFLFTGIRRDIAGV